MPAIWIVCPLYLDVRSFLLLRSRVIEVLGAAGERRRIRFVVSDDSGGQDPEARGLALLPDTQVVRCPYNLGHQRALVYVLRTLRAQVSHDDAVVTMDSDGEDRPEDIPRLLAAHAEAARRMVGQGHEHPLPPWVVLARRTKRREALWFKLLYLAFRFFFVLLTGRTVRTGNFACYPGAVLEELILHPYFDLCYSSTLVRLSVPQSCVPCERGARLAGKSRMDLTRLIMHGIRMLMPFLDQIAARALIAFAGTFVAGIAGAAAVAGVRLFTARAIPGWASSSVMLLLILSSIALGNFLVLFAIFSQSQGIALTRIDRADERAREPFKKSA